MTCGDSEASRRRLFAVFSETHPRLLPRVEGSFIGLRRTGDAVDGVSKYIKKCHFLGTVQHIAICKQNTKPKACHCSQNTWNFLEGKGNEIVLCFNGKVDKVLRYCQAASVSL